MIKTTVAKIMREQDNRMSFGGLAACLGRGTRVRRETKGDALAVGIGKIAEQLLTKVDDLKWAAFVDIIGKDVQRNITRGTAIITADFIITAGGAVNTGSLTPILNMSGVVNDGHVKVVDLVDAVREVQSTAKPVLICDTSHYKGSCVETAAAWTSSALLVPVLLQGVVYGIFRMCSDHKHVFRHEHVAYAAIVASLIQTYLTTNRTTKLVRMSMQNQGVAKAPRRKPDIAQMDVLKEDE